MAKKIVCDICGYYCDDNWRYELIHRNPFSNKRHDICSGCIGRIIKEISREKGAKPNVD